MTGLWCYGEVHYFTYYILGDLKVGMGFFSDTTLYKTPPDCAKSIMLGPSVLVKWSEEE